MDVKEKYSKFIFYVNGQEKIDGAAFKDRPQDAEKLIREDLKNIELFPEYYLSSNMKLIEIVIDTAFGQAMKKKVYNESDKAIFEMIPYNLFSLFYDKIERYVEKDPKLLFIVPDELQKDYMMIPYEAVKRDSSVINAVSKNALRAFPDIELLAKASNE